VKPQYHDNFITQSASSLPLTLFNPSEDDKPGFESRSWLQKNTKALVFGTFVAIALSATCLGQIYGSPQLAQLNEQTSSFISQVCATGFYQTLSIVFLSEIGDNSFFIAGILAIKFSRLVSFLVSTAALALMTFIYVAIGKLFISC